MTGEFDRVTNTLPALRSMDLTRPVSTIQNVSSRHVWRSVLMDNPPCITRLAASKRRHGYLATSIPEPAVESDLVLRDPVTTRPML
ncbi:MAG: hypothetical protein JWN70_5881 [Planctomycetaceae bacterium]|nr:hypothetical protein [Planctomycetaceae bacterium]